MFRSVTRVLAVAAVGMALSVTSVFDKARAAAPGGWQSLTETELTAVWWQWALGIPASTSPLFDSTGANAYVNQPFSGLLFLAGTFAVQELNDDVVGIVTRDITVIQGTALFFPLINTEYDEVCYLPGHFGGNCLGLSDFPAPKSVPQLRSLAAQSVENASQLNATLTPTDQNFNQNGDAITINNSRIQSRVFNYTLPKDNIYGIDVSGKIAPAVSDGYWSLVTADKLQAGHNYLLQFGGQLPINNNQNTFTEIITYRITVPAR
jgi:hypothetical protein